MGNDHSKIYKEIGEWALCIVIAFAVYLVISYFLVTISGVKQSSMYPTAKEGERLLIVKTTIFKKDFKKGDIVVFEAPIDPAQSNDVVLNDKDNLSDEEEPLTNCLASFPDYKGFRLFAYDFLGIGKMEYIKRIVGVAGDHIEITDRGNLYINGTLAYESYVQGAATNPMGKYYNVIVPDNAVFVMGDNRLESKDSRIFGCIPVSKINGYVVTRVWPLTRLGSLNTDK